METVCPQSETELRETLIRHLNAGEISLPVLPAVATQVIGMASNDSSDLSDLSKLIHQDQALAGHVLRIANSALFAGSTAVVSLQQAIARLGMSMISEIATVISIQGQVFKAKGFEAEVHEVWLHALYSGFYGKELARVARQNVESQFLCGLLHTIGKPILFQMIGDLQRNASPAPSKASVTQIIESLHPRAGQLACEKWNLPRRIQDCCAFSQCRDKSTDFADAVRMTYLGGILAGWCVAEDASLESDIRKDPVLAELNFYPDEVDAIIEKRGAVTEVVNSLLSL